MIPLIVASGVLTVAVVVLLVAPLARRRRAAAPRQAYDLAILVQQLAEVDRDAARGVINAPEAEAARVELKRRILAVADAASASNGAAAIDGPRPPAVPAERSKGVGLTAAALAVVVPLLGIGVYLTVGQPDFPDQPLAARLADGDLAQRQEMPAEDRQSLEQTAERLQQFLEKRPNEAEGWLLLGRSRLTLDQPMEAIAALQRAYTLAPGRSDIAGALGEAVVIGAGGEVTEAARDVLTAALASDPRNIQARYYLALGDAQRGEVGKALQGWVDVVALSPADAPWLPQVTAQIGEAAAALGMEPTALRPSPAAMALASQAPAPGGDASGSAVGAAGAGERGIGPSPADMEAAAAMTPAEREQMIRGMVARLAERLAADPNDADGWLRLARAYDVLGEPGKAADARARAEAASRR
ncbi:MAG: c-type cytochrome biogenesis protein CcmI [Rhodospirillales bacterium]